MFTESTPSRYSFSSLVWQAYVLLESRDFAPAQDAAGDGRHQSSGPYTFCLWLGPEALELGFFG